MHLDGRLLIVHGVIYICVTFFFFNSTMKLMCTVISYQISMLRSRPTTDDNQIIFLIHVVMYNVVAHGSVTQNAIILFY